MSCAPRSTARSRPGSGVMAYIRAPAVAKTLTSHQATLPLLAFPASSFPEVLENSGIPFEILGKTLSQLEGPLESV